jgi:hypothetical protein
VARLWAHPLEPGASALTIVSIWFSTRNFSFVLSFIDLELRREPLLGMPLEERVVQSRTRARAHVEPAAAAQRMRSSAGVLASSKAKLLM